MEVEVNTLHAFSDKALGGNPAGVVLQAAHLSESQMQEVARQVGFSETAFVMPSDQADFKVRFFTPSDEVDLCGHATIALFYLMKTQHLVDVGTYTLETLAGILKVVIEVNGEVYLSQTLPDHCMIYRKRAQRAHPMAPCSVICIFTTSLQLLFITRTQLDRGTL